MAESKHEREIVRLLEASGAVYIGSKSGHLKYRLPDGRSFVMAGTPGDYRNALNALRDLHKLLGIKRPKVDASEPRRSRHKPRASRHEALDRPAPALRSLRSELSKLFPEPLSRY